MRRVFIVHGWDGSPNEKMHRHLTEELSHRSYEVSALKMPTPTKPTIKSWVNYLSNSVGKTDKDDYFIGHSIGCQAVLRYLETLPANSEVGGALLIAPWMHLDENTLREEGIEAQKIAEPWMKTPIDWQKIKSVCPVITCIFSDDDPYVPLSDEIIFRDNLEARIVVLKSRGHFTDEDGDKAWPNIIKEFDRISSN